MLFLAISFLAGVLTVLAPCILPLLPVVVGATAAGKGKATPYIIVGSLAVSVIAFTYLLKVSSSLVAIPPEAWTYLSGGIIGLFGITLVWPGLWERVPGMGALSSLSNRLMGVGYQRKDIGGDILIGASLGPVFSTCSPTYFVILASVLPASFALGTAYILAYVFGLSLVLLLLALLGQRFADRLAFASDPRGYFKRGIGVLFIVLGIFIVSGWEKRLEVAILENGFFDITQVEQYLLKKSSDTTPVSGTPYAEITNPSGFLNTEPLTISELVGKKVILVDFMTYSCINCQRTFPYLVAWYDRYRDQGLEIIAIHTPEFAFERDINNVRSALERFGIAYPVVLDNEYATWRAWGNQYWPRKYLIDIHGSVVYDHIGEGAYEETEMKVRELLAERAEALGQTPGDEGALASEAIAQTDNEARSPETYFGSSRNEYLGNGARGRAGEQTLAIPSLLLPNMLYLGGTWNITPEYAEATAGASVSYRYYAKQVHVVAEAAASASIEVWQDGVMIKTIRVEESTLYTLISDPAAGEHALELRIRGAGVRLFAFTFG